MVIARVTKTIYVTLKCFLAPLHSCHHRHLSCPMNFLPLRQSYPKLTVEFVTEVWQGAFPFLLHLTLSPLETVVRRQ
jgi:hypothetical protein